MGFDVRWVNLVMDCVTSIATPLLLMEESVALFSLIEVSGKVTTYLLICLF